jgi:hypothetical protein
MGYWQNNEFCHVQGSRRHYCIHKKVSKEPSVDEGCDKLLEDGGCRHAERAKLLSNKSDRLKARMDHTVQAAVVFRACARPTASHISGCCVEASCLRMTPPHDEVYAYSAGAIVAAQPPEYSCHMLQVHDIEDLASEGRRLSACPYFASREFAQDAEIVFCPYSYLVRPQQTPPRADIALPSPPTCMQLLEQRVSG